MPPDWFVLGARPNGSLQSVPPRGSLICLGEPGTYKSSGIIQPNALPWNAGPVVVRSTRADNRRRVLSANLAAGRPCLVLDLDAAGGLPAGCVPYRVSLLQRSSSWTGAHEVALRLMRATREPGNSVDGTTVAFEDFAADLLGALMFAAAVGRSRGLDLTMRDVAEWFAELGTSAPADVSLAVPRRLLDVFAGHDGRIAIGGLENVADDRMNRRDTIQKVREAVGHLLVGRPLDQLASADRHGWTAADQTVADGSIVFIEVSDDHPVRARMHAALSSLVEDDLVAAARRRWRSGWTGEPLRLLYDESATGAVNPNIPAWAATGAGDGIALILCAQSLHQLERVFGDEGAGLINVFTHRLFLRGHALDGERVASMFGQHDVNVVERGWNRPFMGLPGASGGTRVERRARVEADHLVRIPDGYGLLASRDLVGRIRLLPSFGEPWRSRFPE